MVYRIAEKKTELLSSSFKAFKHQPKHEICLFSQIHKKKWQMNWNENSLFWLLSYFSFLTHLSQRRTEVKQYLIFFFSPSFLATQIFVFAVVFIIQHQVIVLCNSSDSGHVTKRANPDTSFKLNFHTEYLSWCEQAFSHLAAVYEPHGNKTWNVFKYKFQKNFLHLIK